MSSSASSGFLVRVFKKILLLFFATNILFCLLFSHDVLDIFSFRLWGTRFFAVFDYLIEIAEKWIRQI